MDEHIEEAARKIKEAGKRASDAIAAAYACVEEAEQQASERAKKAIAVASIQLEKTFIARTEEIEHRANERANKLIAEAIAEASARAEAAANARAAQAGEVLHAHVEEIKRQGEEIANARTAQAEEAANARVAEIERRGEEIARNWEERYNKVMESVEKFRMIIEKNFHDPPDSDELEEENAVSQLMELDRHNDIQANSRRKSKEKAREWSERPMDIENEEPAIRIQTPDVREYAYLELYIELYFEGSAGCSFSTTICSCSRRGTREDSLCFQRIV